MEFEKDETFLKIVPLVLNSEGDYTNHPKDPGGPTNRGIAWNYNADYLRQKFGFKTAADIKKLTADKPNQLYNDRFMLASGGDGITDVDLAYLHFDTAVNCGVGTAYKMLGRLSHNPKHFDGRGGKNRTIFLQLFLEYIAQRLSYYTHCRNRDAFLEGWVNRITHVIANAKDLD